MANKKSFTGLVIRDLDQKNRNPKSKKDELKQLVYKKAAKNVSKQLLNKSKELKAGIVTIELEHTAEPEKPATQKRWKQGQKESFFKVSCDTKIDLLGIIIYKLISRTPVDDDYRRYVAAPNKKKLKWTVGHPDSMFYTGWDPVQKRMILKRKSAKAIWEHENKVSTRIHRKDDEVMRNEWNIEVTVKDGVLSSSKLTFTTLSFSGVDFDKGFKSHGDTSDGEWEKVADVLRQAIGIKMITNYKIWNESPYWRLIEYGEYVKDYSSEKGKLRKRIDRKFAQIDDNGRLHGVTKEGYSYQAPAGIVTRVVAEMNALEYIAEQKNLSGNTGYEGYKVSTLLDKKHEDNLFKDKRLLNKEMLQETHERWYYWVSIEDFYETVQKRKKSLPVTIANQEPPTAMGYGFNAQHTRTRTWAEVYDKRKEEEEARKNRKKRAEQKAKSDAKRYHSTKILNARKAMHKRDADGNFKIAEEDYRFIGPHDELITEYLDSKINGSICEIQQMNILPMLTRKSADFENFYKQKLQQQRENSRSKQLEGKTLVPSMGSTGNSERDAQLEILRAVHSNLRETLVHVPVILKEDGFYILDVTGEVKAEDYIRGNFKNWSDKQVKRALDRMYERFTFTKKK